MNFLVYFSLSYFSNFIYFQSINPMSFSKWIWLIKSALTSIIIFLMKTIMYFLNMASFHFKSIAILSYAHYLSKWPGIITSFAKKTPCFDWASNNFFSCFYFPLMETTSSFSKHNNIIYFKSIIMGPMVTIFMKWPRHDGLWATISVPNKHFNWTSKFFY